MPGQLLFCLQLTFILNTRFKDLTEQAGKQTSQSFLPPFPFLGSLAHSASKTSAHPGLSCCSDAYCARGSFQQHSLGLTLKTGVWGAVYSNPNKIK